MNIKVYNQMDELVAHHDNAEASWGGGSLVIFSGRARRPTFVYAAGMWGAVEVEYDEYND